MKDTLVQVLQSIINKDTNHTYHPIEQTHHVQATIDQQNHFQLYSNQYPNERTSQKHDLKWIWIMLHGRDLKLSYWKSKESPSSKKLKNVRPKAKAKQVPKRQPVLPKRIIKSPAKKYGKTRVGKRSPPKKPKAKAFEISRTAGAVVIQPKQPEQPPQPPQPGDAPIIKKKLKGSTWCETIILFLVHKSLSLKSQSAKVVK